MRSLVGAAIAALATAFADQVSAVEWNVSLWGQRRASTEHVHKLAELVDEKTGGEFTLKIDYGGLSRNVENLDGISIDAFEMAQFCAGYHADKNPTLTVLELPFLGVSTLEEEVAVSQAVYGHSAVQEDLGRWNARLLMPSPTPQRSIVGTGEARDSLDEFRGMRVLATGGIGKALEAVGAVPTPGTSSDAYDALGSGVVDAIALAPDAHLSFRTIDLADWRTDDLELGTVNCPVAVNLDAYEALSPEHRKALDDSVGEALQHYLENYSAVLAEWERVLDAKGVLRLALPEEDLEAFREVAAPIHDDWIESAEAQGLPGRLLYDLVQQTLDEVRTTTN